jgi:two-component system, NtrC family, sensor histidine kinase PilS
MSLAADRMLKAGGGEFAPAGAADPFWRSLFFFNLYRCGLAALLFAIGASAFGGALPFGARDHELYLALTAGYFLVSLGYFGLVQMRWRFDLQLTLQVVSDVAFIIGLVYASDGVGSGLGLLLLTTLAGAGLVARGRMIYAYAAVATIALLLVHTYGVLAFDAPVAQYAQTGLLAGGYFAVAWVAHTLAQYALASEELAAQREIDLENMAQASEHVIREMHDGVLVVDGEGHIRQCNAQSERILGPLWARQDVRLAEYAPELAQRYDAWREARAGSEPAALAANPKVSARFVPVGRRRSAGAVIFLEDLTRIQAEARQMKLAAMGRLTANIAHEIRNPLGAIGHAAELLREETVLDETAQRLVTIIHDNAQRLDRMVNDVLRLRRSDAAHRETFDLIEYLETFVEQFCRIQKLPRETFTLELRARPEVEFDRSHLNQVMWNLCRNAARHCSREKGSIRIAVEMLEREGAVKLDVIDDGPGVAPALRHQLFEPFFTTAAGGTGLGLYIAREVCEANRARLDYVETPAGARFTMICRAARPVEA